LFWLELHFLMLLFAFSNAVLLPNEFVAVFTFPMADTASKEARVIFRSAGLIPS
jgi:hypothetical protein